MGYRLGCAVTVAVVLLGDGLVPASVAAGWRSETHPVHTSGAWKTAGKAGGPAQRWSLDALQFADDRLLGRISIADSHLLTAGNLEGQVSGHYISGTLSDDEGNVLVDFEGKMTGTGMRGRYRDRTGETGAWEWKGKFGP